MLSKTFHWIEVKEFLERIQKSGRRPKRANLPLWET